MKWFRVAFEEALTHAVSSSLLNQLVVDMATRGHPIEDFQKKYGKDHARALDGNPASITEWGFDIGGMYFGGMPVEQLAIDGLLIDVPCDMFEAVVAHASRATQRHFDDGSGYYKLKFWLHATVLTPAQYDEVCGELGVRRRTAQERAEIYFDSRRRSGASP